MTDFVIKANKEIDGVLECNETILKYAEFFKKPLTLEMFVPCDENGNVLEEPYFDGENDNYYNSAMDEFQKAKEKVLFEGFEVEPTENNQFQYLWLDKKFICSFPLIEADRIRKVEDLIPYEIELTPSALKAIGIKE